MKKSGWLLLGLMLIATSAMAQLMTENFSYDAGALATTSGGTWVAFSGAGVQPILVSDGNLSHPGYSASDIGRKVSLAAIKGSAEDAYHDFTNITVEGSTIYAAFLLNVIDTVYLAANSNTAGEYFVAFIPGTSTSNYVARIAIRKGSSGNTYQLGIKAGQAGTQTPEWVGDDLNPGETYLVVMSYQIVTGITNDIGKLWINPTISGSQPAPNVTQTSTNDVSAIGRIALRQGYTSATSSTTPNAIIDGITVSEFWDNTLLPVQLASFAAVRVSDDVQLNWSTLTEVNNFGFYVERKLEGTSTFTEIPNSFVAGHRTTLEAQSYTFTDNTVAPGMWYYRLRQVDLDGKISYSDPVKVEFTTDVATGTPATYTLSQNFPNPFNPSTDIQFTLAKAGTVSLKVYDMLGREVAMLANGEYAAGVHHVMFNAINLPSGAYFYSLKAGNFSAMKSMLLVK
jgi:hypothetical protein